MQSETPIGERIEICTEVARWVAHRAQKKNVAVDNYQLELHCLSRSMCTAEEWGWIMRKAAAFKDFNQQIAQKIENEEARLAEKLYELGKVQSMIFNKEGQVWVQTPARARGLYFVSLKQRA